jgi:hypothetical protein
VLTHALSDGWSARPVRISYLAGDPALLDDRFPLPLDRPFTTRQALREGVTPAMLTDLVARGFLRRPLKGVYFAAQAEDSRRTRGQALALSVPPGSVIADWTALWFWTGLDRPGTQHGCPPLTVFRFRGHERLRNKLVNSGERWFRPSDVAPVEPGLLITVPIRTIWDIGRFSPRIIALGGMDALARHGDIAVEEIVAGVERFRRQRGVVQLRDLATRVDARSESIGESAVRLHWTDTPGLPKPEPQVSVYDAMGTERFRLDLGVEALRFAAEYDGEAFHSSDVDRKHDEWRRDVLDREHGWEILVLRRENVFGVHADASSRLCSAIEKARKSRARRL